MDRLDDVPPYQVLVTEMEARFYNRGRLALVRLRGPLRLRLPTLRHLDIVLSGPRWVLVDRNLNDLPVLAWTEFETWRTSLHAPVRCKLRLYHRHAERIADKVLQELDAELAKRLSRAG